ncbi:MAG: hypothetical protein J07HX5_01595 [halophilic archaeon J07HX5]|nr:MAG: hypothetical protein J07HX5_01595 [halophilic archaeon J07HX5]
MNSLGLSGEYPVIKFKHKRVIIWELSPSHQPAYLCNRCCRNVYICRNRLRSLVCGHYDDGASHCDDNQPG